eukprot:3676815-Heterocapsa_arctica.AAC.1
MLFHVATRAFEVCQAIAEDSWAVLRVGRVVRVRVDRGARVFRVEVVASCYRRIVDSRVNRVVEDRSDVVRRC